MIFRSAPKAFVSFSTRLDLATHQRRQRLERAYGKSAPGLLEKLFREFEDQLLKQFTDEERGAYFADDSDVLRAGRLE